MWLYILLGMLLSIAVYVSYRMLKPVYKNILEKFHRVKVQPDENIQKALKTIETLTKRLDILESNFEQLKEFSQQTIEAAAIMNPTEFTTEKDDNGNTIFLKNGREKTYETIDWRNR